jgi:hypothetical protein
MAFLFDNIVGSGRFVAHDILSPATLVHPCTSSVRCRLVLMDRIVQMPRRPWTAESGRQKFSFLEAPLEHKA